MTPGKAAGLTIAIATIVGGFTLFALDQQKRAAAEQPPQQIVAVTAKLVRDSSKAHSFLRIINHTKAPLLLKKRFDHEALIDMSEGAYRHAREPVHLAARDSLDTYHFQWVVSTEREEFLGTLGAPVY